MPVTGTPAQPLYRAGNTDGGDDSPRAVANWRAHGSDAGLALGDRLSPAAPPDFGKRAAGEPAPRQQRHDRFRWLPSQQDLCRGARRHRKNRTYWDGVAKTTRALGGSHTNAFIGPAKVELGAFACGVTKCGQQWLGGGEKHVRRRVRELTKTWAGTPAPLRVANQNPVYLKGLSQPVRRCPWQFRSLNKFGKACAINTGGKDHDRLVKHANARHTVSHTPKHTSQVVGCPDGGRHQ